MAAATSTPEAARPYHPRRLRIRGGMVLTLNADGAIYDPGEVIVEDSQIMAVGPRTDLPPVPDEELLDAPRGLILPGLVNAHCHSSDALVRGTAPAQPLEAWSQFTEAGRLGRTPREVYLSAMLTATEALRTGTTTLLDHLRLSPRLSLDGLEAAAQAYLDAGIRAVVAPVLSDLPAADTLPLDLIDLPASLAGPLLHPTVPWQEQADLCETFIKGWKSRTGVQVGPSAPHRCSNALLERCGQISQRHGVRIHTHFLETVAQAVVAQQRFRRGAARHLADLGLLPRSSLVHCVLADEFETIVASGAVVVHCPIANLRLASGTMAWKPFTDRGARIALGTDGVLCNDSLSMLTVMKVTGLLHADGPGPDAMAILRAAAQHGAAACGLTGIGAIASGLRADLIIMEASYARDPAAQVVYGEEWNPPRTVIVDGRIVVRGGRVVTVDEDAIAEEAREASAHLVARNAARFQAAREMAPHMLRMVARAREVYASTRSGATRSGSFSSTSD